MPRFHPSASGQSKQVNFAGGNFAPIILAGEPPEHSLHQLPPAVGDFTGRWRELEALKSVIAERGSARTVVNLYGPPGVGKSALALQLAHRLSEDRSWSAQLYVDVGASGANMSAREILAHLLTALGPDPVVDRSAAELRSLYLSQVNKLYCLMILDNVGSADQVRSLIPNSPNAIIIMTSREPLATVAGVAGYKVSTLKPSEAVELLVTISGRDLGSLNIEAVEAVVELCGRLPLAIRVAGAILKKRPYWTVERLVAELASEQTRLAALAVDDLDVRGSFDLSYNALDELDRQIFRMSTLCPGTHFRASDVAVLLDCSEHAVRQALDRVVDAQLLETTDGASYRLHDLVALYAAAQRDAAEEPNTISSAKDRLLRALVDEFVHDNQTASLSRQWLFSESITAGWDDRSVDLEAFYMPQILRRVSDGDRGTPWERVIERASRTLVLGGPGSGKTTLTEWACMEIASGRIERFNLGLSIPLRRFDPGESLERLILGVHEHRTGKSAAEAVVRRVLSGRRVLICFDSLDELAEPLRVACIDAIERFSRAYPEVTVVVTSRPDTHLSRAGLPDFTTYRLAPPSHSAIRKYAHSWFDDPSTAEALLSQLAAPTTAALNDNPLLLSWYMSAYDHSGQIAVDELDLHDATYDMHLFGRDINRAVTRADPFSIGAIAHSAESVARWCKSSDDRVFGVPYHRLHVFLLEQMRHREGDHVAPEEIDSLIDILWQQTSVLYEVDVDLEGNRILSIIQDSFGEYLAARDLVQTASSVPDLIDDIITLASVGRFGSGWKYALQMFARVNFLDPRVDATAERMASQLYEAAADYRGPGTRHVTEALLS